MADTALLLGALVLAAGCVLGLLRRSRARRLAALRAWLAALATYGRAGAIFIGAALLAEAKRLEDARSAQEPGGGDT